MWSNSAAVVEHVKNAFSATEADNSKLDDSVLNIIGVTGRKTRMFYNNLGNTSEPTVLIDVGTKNGSSTASFLKNNDNIKACVIDDWTHGGSSEELINTVNSSKLTNIVSKPETVDISLLPKANVLVYDNFYFDGELVRGIQKLSNVLADVCVLIVDDWNAIGVVQQTYSVLSSIDYTVVYENGVKTNYDSEAAATYWNGIGVFVLVKNGVTADAPVTAPTPAPVVEAPAPAPAAVVEAPAPAPAAVVEAPAAEAPAAVAEAPVAEAPVAEAPVAEAPVETPA
jgi:hypothetical protein